MPGMYPRMVLHGEGLTKRKAPCSWFASYILAQEPAGQEQPTGVQLQGLYTRNPDPKSRPCRGASGYIRVNSMGKGGVWGGAGGRDSQQQADPELDAAAVLEEHPEGRKEDRKKHLAHCGGSALANHFALPASFRGRCTGQETTKMGQLFKAPRWLRVRRREGESACALNGGSERQGSGRRRGVQ